MHNTNYALLQVMSTGESAHRPLAQPSINGKRVIGVHTTLNSDMRTYTYRMQLAERPLVCACVRARVLITHYPARPRNRHRRRRAHHERDRAASGTLVDAHIRIE